MSRRRVVIALLVIAGALGWVAISGLRNSLVYYRTPTEVLQMGSDAVGQQIRLGGYVVPGSVRDHGDNVDFVVSDGTSRMSVVASGVPSLFREGRGVVLEGFETRNGSFRADTVLVKHGEDYHPPRPGETPTSADVGT